MRLGLDQVVVLLAEELVALLGFLVFLDGHQVHRPHLINARLQRLDLLRHGAPIRRRARRGHLRRCQHVNPRRPLVRVGDRNALAADVVGTDMILLLDPLAQVLDRHVLLRQLDFERPALLL